MKLNTLTLCSKNKKSIPSYPLLYERKIENQFHKQTQKEKKSIFDPRKNHYPEKTHQKNNKIKKEKKR